MFILFQPLSVKFHQLKSDIDFNQSAKLSSKHAKEATAASEAGYCNGYFDYARYWVQRKPRKITTGTDRQGQNVFFHFVSFKEKINTTLKVPLSTINWAIFLADNLFSFDLKNPTQTEKHLSVPLSVRENWICYEDAASSPEGKKARKIELFAGKQEQKTME